MKIFENLPEFDKKLEERKKKEICFKVLNSKLIKLNI